MAVFAHGSVFYGLSTDTKPSVLIAQNNIAGNHIVVFAVIVDVFPKGVV